MSPIPPDVLLQQLQWRYAVKKFDATRVIPPEHWEALEQTLVLTPSSFGLQPWKFWVITNPAIKEQLVGASWRQRQLADASHVVVLAIKVGVGEADVDRFIARTADVQGIAIETLAKLRSVVVGFLQQPAEKFHVDQWSAKQVYIALGNFMTAAAMLGIDTCPMEGIDPAQYDQILGLREQGYATAVACVAGYRALDDRSASRPKVRYLRDEIITRLE